MFHKKRPMIYEPRLMEALEASPIREPSELLGFPATRIDLSAKGVVTVDTKDELSELMKELELILGQPLSTPIEHIIRHEGQHESAWKVIGCLGVQFGLSLSNYSQVTNGVHITFFTATSHAIEPSPLEVAAAAAYPEDPSDGDIAQVINYGFSGGVLEVAYRAIINNRAGRKHIPVPLSWNGIENTRTYTVGSSHDVSDQLELF